MADENPDRPDPIRVQIEVWTDLAGKVHGVFGINRQPRTSSEASRLHTHCAGLAEGAMAIFQAHYLQEAARAENGKVAAPVTPKILQPR